MGDAAIRDIEKRLAYFESITSWSPVPPGSILRVPAYSFPNWGITPSADNLRWLITAADRAYSLEWKDTDDALNRLISDASRAAGLGDVNLEMNSIVGKYGARHIVDVVKAKGSFRCIDLGAGTGATTVALLRELARYVVGISEPCRMILVEPSAQRAQTAEKNVADALALLKVKHRIQCEVLRLTDSEALATFEKENADIIISNAAIHHHSFNLHLRSIQENLRVGMPFINGDWHNSMWESPERAYWLLYLLQDPHDSRTAFTVLEFLAGNAAGGITTERKELREFRKYFSIDAARALSAFDGLGDPQRRANAAIARFWLEVGKRFSHAERAPISFLEAHEPVGTRRQNLIRAGFVFDDECMHKYRSLLRGAGKGDLASVMMVKKPLRPQFKI